MTERIGVLMVHGIGTNTPNQFLVDQTRKIVAAMSEEVESITVLSEPVVGKEVPDHYVVDYTNNMVKVEAKTKAEPGAPSRDLLIEFNEVYWADLGEKPTLINQIKFWFWALSMWSVAARDFTTLDTSGVYIPRGGGIRGWERLLLAFYGILFFLGAATIGLLNVIADRVKLPRVPISDILTAYLGDVMLYSQTAGDDDPEVQDFELPPRVGIRRRMVDAIVEFALRDYKAWYVVAHSQGTVVAYNGLMETAKTLPNYLNRGRWDLVRSSPLRLLGGPDDKLPGLQMPRRPPWLGAQDCIDRRNLFAKLRGFLTYGSAIGKFRGIWPIIVPANTDEHVFQREFNWINVYDWTDPVGGPLRAYNREKGYDANRTPLKDGDRVVKGHVAAKIDRNISYKAGWVWLLSHLQYLNYYPRAYKRPKALLVNKAAEWLLGGDFDPGETLEKAKPNGVIRYALALAEAGIATLVVWLATAALLWELLDSKWLAWLEYACWPSLAISALIVAIIANGCGALIGGTRRSVPRVVRWLVILIGCAAIAAPSFLLIPWVSGNIAGWWKAAGSTIGLLNHPGAGNMAIGLMSLTVTLIVALGGIRWLFQPIPAAPAPAEPAPAAPAPVPPPKDEKP